MEQIELIDGIAYNGMLIYYVELDIQKISSNFLVIDGDLDIHTKGGTFTTPSFITLEGLKKYCNENDIQYKYDACLHNEQSILIESKIHDLERNLVLLKKQLTDLKQTY